MKMVNVHHDLAKEHYKKDDEWLLKVGEKLIKNQGLDPEKEDPMHHGQKICDSLAEDLQIFPVIAMVLEGHNAIKVVRKMVGEQSPENSMPGTIRGDYTLDSYALADTDGRSVRNLIHASGTVEEAQQEIKIWFKNDEVHAYTHLHEKILYDVNLDGIKE